MDGTDSLKLHQRNYSIQKHLCLDNYVQAFGISNIAGHGSTTTLNSTWSLDMFFFQSALLCSVHS